ncbi:hypothetical protein [Acetoanaerobium noterae]
MKPALVIIDMKHYFFRSEERRVKLSELKKPRGTVLFDSLLVFSLVY